MTATRPLAAALVVIAAAVPAAAGDGPPSRDNLVPAVGAPVMVATPWPVAAPCDRPTELLVDDALGGDVVWSSGDGATLLRFPAPLSNRPIRLPRTFAATRIDHLTVSALPAQLGKRYLVELLCPGDATVAWGPCQDGLCSVTTTQRTSWVPRALRTSRWVKPMRYPGDIEEVGDIHYSLFLKRIGYPEDDDPEVARQALRFTRDLVADLRTFLRTACARSRCGDVVVRVQRAADAYLAGGAPAYAGGDHRKRHNHWNRGWSWRATAGGATFEAGCNDMREDPRVTCGLSTEIAGDDGALVGYHARTADYQAFDDLVLTAGRDSGGDHRLGRIRFLTDDAAHGNIWLEVSGRALATRRALPRP